MTDRFEVTIYHNPTCQTSRNALAAIRVAGHAPSVVEYLKVGWTVPQLRALLEAMDARARDVLRTRGAPAEAVDLTGAAASDDDLLAAMVKFPVLVERPIVVTPKGTVLARPIERLDALL